MGNNVFKRRENKEEVTGGQKYILWGLVISFLQLILTALGLWLSLN